MSFPVLLALKYLKPKRSVASVITCVSILGVMLGVAAVIIVRSVMTGFGDIWEEKIFWSFLQSMFSAAILTG